MTDCNLFFSRSYSGYPFQAFLSCCFFLRQKKSFLWSLFFAKKKYNNPAKGFPLLSGLKIRATNHFKPIQLAKPKYNLFIC
ncbi:MAG: hypothetical protein CVU07_04115 [Bacteroidetes bacterium HGW-Bacteroidetes-23]|nr:MAG: hypothetical protein CVU07_04115 [Bacteroidetes bacterium HGW-Bacteroidetes-23]